MAFLLVFISFPTAVDLKFSTHSVFDVVVVVAVDLDRRLVTQPTCPTQRAHVYVTCAARIVQIQIESTLVFALLIKPQVSGRSTSITTLLPSHVVTSTVVSGHPRLLLLSVSAVSDVAS